MKKYVVGIDLGTSNCAVAYGDIEAARAGGGVEALDLEQLVAGSEVGALGLLPSTIYRPSPHELADGALALPFGPERSDAVGEWARAQGARVPGRLVHSAKSWLCHGAVDRRSALLPPAAPADVTRLSPVDASARLLEHLRDVWDHHFSDARLAEQTIVLTVPASFDAGARTLTLEAARKAGLDADLVLLEEPQAAFYDYWVTNKAALADAKADRLVLVVDVGGGTTDLTLIRVAWADGGNPEIERLAVGRHILLGGDNMDMTLARQAEEQLGKQLDAARWSLLVQACRQAKEAMLSGDADAPQAWKLTVPGRGSKLFGGALSTELAAEDVRARIVDGFFPIVERGAQPERGTRTGLVKLGLPYEHDPAITRHVSAFLARHEATPDAVLLNGGVFNSPILAGRMIEAVGGVDRLEHGSLNRAVARGAAIYGLTRAGIGDRIGGGSAHSYFVSVGSDDDVRALCLIPRGHPVGQRAALTERTFQLVVGRPVEFQLYEATSTRPTAPGELVGVDGDDFEQLPPIRTVLESAEGRAQIPIVLQAALTEVGALDLSCVGVDRDVTWQLEFDLRGTGRRPAGKPQGEAAPRLSRPLHESAAGVIGAVFGKAGPKLTPREIRGLPTRLQDALKMRPKTWSLPVLRELWDMLAPNVKRRRRSPEHEMVFFNMAGHMLRPGFGYPMDEWRVRELWGIFRAGVQFHQQPQVWAAWWIMWRRVAGGLSKEQHEALLASVTPWLRPKLAPRPSGKMVAHGRDEMLKLVASLERLDPAVKAEWGDWILGQIVAGDTRELLTWALARIGARMSFSGAVHNGVDPDVAERWTQQLLGRSWKKTPAMAWAVAHLTRRTDDRLRDVDAQVRHRVVQRLTEARAPELARLVRDVVALEAADEGRFVGDSLPPGLVLL